MHIHVVCVNRPGCRKLEDSNCLRVAYAKGGLHEPVRYLWDTVIMEFLVISYLILYEYMIVRAHFRNGGSDAVPTARSATWRSWGKRSFRRRTTVLPGSSRISTTLRNATKAQRPWHQPSRECLTARSDFTSLAYRIISVFQKDGFFYTCIV